MVVPDTSVPVVTRSLQLEPANFVSTHARLRKSHIFNVRSWLPVTTFDGSPKNLAAITFPLWPVKVCYIEENREDRIVSLIFFYLLFSHRFSEKGTNIQNQNNKRIISKFSELSSKRKIVFKLSFSIVGKQSIWMFWLIC